MRDRASIALQPSYLLYGFSVRLLFGQAEGPLDRHAFHQILLRLFLFLKGLFSLLLGCGELLLGLR